jgi:hypothetical protein
VTFLGMEKGNGTTLTREHNTSDVDYNWVCLNDAKSCILSITWHIILNLK